jgi:membrane protease YdiL (CAAX protease family)
MSRGFPATVLAVAAGAAGFPGVSLRTALAPALALVLLFVPYLLCGVTRPRAPRSLAWVAALLVPYLLYALGTRTFDWLALARLGGYVALPTLLVSLNRERRGPGLLDLLAILAIWLPFDLQLLGGIWTWPEPNGLPFLQAVLAVDLALYLFVIHRGIEGVGYRFVLTPRHAVVALANVAFFSILAIPLGLGIGFLTYQPRPFDALGLLGSFFAILVFIGIPEELLFRGLIQNLLEQWWGKAWPSLAVAAVVFGAAHLNNRGWPNFAYALMATLAGIFYGLAFRQGGNLMPAALVHTLVDSVWVAFFR